MADDDGNVPNKPSKSYNRPQQPEAFHRTQETQVEHKFPNRSTGIVPLPPGSRGPRSLYLKRHGDSFGFTLRHFIVYPPDSVTEDDGRHAAVGALSTPMDTIFVKLIKDRGPAKQAGLQRGDRLVAVNGIPVTDKSYSQVVQLIQNSPDYLHLLVVPKEEDILQRYFSDTAYNPASNQNLTNDKQQAQNFLTQTFNQCPIEFQVDSISWNSLRNPYNLNPVDRLCDNSSGKENFNEIYTEIHTNDDRKIKQQQQFVTSNRAQPQVPIYKKMGRRASDGCTLSTNDYYNPTEFSSLNSDLNKMVANNNNNNNNNNNTNNINKINTSRNPNMLNNYPNKAGCRLSLDAGRRESSSSLTSTISTTASSLIDKDSLFDSTSTLTGHETDDSAIMTRYRKSFQQKEEFLKMPVSTTPSNDSSLMIQREFYGRPKKLEKAMWPPLSPPIHQETKTNSKPIHQNFQRVKNDIETERDLLKLYGGKRESLDGIQEAPTTSLDDSETSDNDSDGKRIYPPNHQIVHKRTKEFESGKPLPEDDPILSNRTSFYRSELARLSSKRVVPNVTERAQEYEIRSIESSSPPLKRDQTISGSSTNSSIKKVHSLESSDLSENEALKIRARSNSAESWVAALQQNESKLLENQQEANKVIGDDKPVVVKRRTKNTNLAEDERTMRRESYLKATEGGRMPFDNDLSDGDISPQVLRSAHRRWRPPLFPGDIQQLRKLFEDAASSLGGSVSGNSSSSASLDRDKLLLDHKEKDNNNIIIKEGALHCKITEIDGKRFGDRSWKQIWAMLRGPKLFLYKDRHHQSPIGSADAVEHSLANGVDMRASCVRVAEDYTKRKNVLRLSSVNPCRSEFLLQADNTDDLADWVKVLQEQMATTTDVEAKFDPVSNSKQQAVPQANPATTSIQIQGSTRLPPQQQQQTAKSLLIRNRSPTGQSPVSKTRKPSQQQIFVEQQLNTSPKSKTWRGRVVKQFRKMQGNTSTNSQPNSPTQPQMHNNQQFDGSTFGIMLDQCIPSLSNPFVPRFVEICTNIVDAKGLHTIGIYRVPGNNASITQLTDEINRNYDYVPIDDPKWNDLHVVSSLLKSYFRKMPDSLITNHSYPYFIQADKCDNPQLRMRELKKLIKNLPAHNYHTLKHLVLHLKRVIDNSDVNKMEAKNLAIVFGPTIVRPEEENMESMVNNMTHQCKIVETLLTCTDWFFNDDDDDDDNNCDLPVLGAANVAAADLHDDLETGNNQALLLDNISKYEALKEKEKNGALFSSIISAAQRKVKRKATKGASSLCNEAKDDTNNGIGTYPRPFSLTDLKDSTTTENKTNIIPTTVTDMEKNNKKRQQQQTEKVPWFNYSTDQEDFHRRIENFELETRAMLQMPRNLEISISNIVPKSAGNLSSSSSNVNQNVRLTAKPSDLLKTHSASNVFSRQLNVENNNNNNNRNSLDNSSFKTVQYTSKTTTESDKNYELQINNNDSNKNIIIENKGAFSDNNRNVRFTLRRGSSVENINSSSIDLNTNGTMKKIKYENEAENFRSGSLDSLNKITSTDDDTDLVTSLTKLYDKKLKEKSQTCLTAGNDDDIPYVDESPEKTAIKPKQSDKENVPLSELLYRNPSLHKNQSKELKRGELEKDEDSTEKVQKTKLMVNGGGKIGSKLKRSESLNKPDRSPINNSKLKRSESLNKADKLTKMEKTDLNLSKRRITKEIKLKRKNGMPDRSIKRRHTVGGTKDPDKLNWLDNKQPTTMNDTNKERNLRTSSPDLSSTRKEKLFLEINLIGPGNMVMALKQHLIGARPQSFPESTVFKVPLESHV